MCACGEGVTFCNFTNGPKKGCIPLKLSVKRKFELKLNVQGAQQVMRIEMAIIVLGQ
jgi:hypothetical protein